jgi:hypothetical protein
VAYKLVSELLDRFIRRRGASTPALPWGEVRHSTAKHRPIRVLDA